MGSTPVAKGSSVPAWPTRLAPVNDRNCRTTVNEVAPAGLSMFRTPTCIRDRLDCHLPYSFDGRIHGQRHLCSGGSQMASSSEMSAHSRRVNRAPAANADLGQSPADL